MLYNIMAKYEDWMQDIDNDCPETMETHLKSGRINTTKLYGAFKIPLLAHFLLYRNSDVAVVKKLINLCLAYGADINQVVMDTDDEWSYPLHIMFSYYLGLCLYESIESRKREILSVITLLLRNGADPLIVLPDGTSIPQTLQNIMSDPSTKSKIDPKDIDILCIVLDV